MDLALIRPPGRGRGQAPGYRTPSEVFHGEHGVVEEESNGMRYSAGTGAELLAGAEGLSPNSALILSK